MALESAPYISDLVAANPTHDDPLSLVDSHARLIKAVLQDTFPGLTGAVTGTHTQLNAVTTALTTQVLSNITTALSDATKLVLSNGQGSVSINDNNGQFQAVNQHGGSMGLTSTGVLRIDGTAPDFLIGPRSVGASLVPSGGIIMWSGAASNIPTGWVLCNGANGAPNLQDRFIVGAGNSYAVGASGGATSQAVQTDSQGSHSHGSATAAAGNFTGTWATDKCNLH